MPIEILVGLSYIFLVLFLKKMFLQIKKSRLFLTSYPNYYAYNDNSRGSSQYWSLITEKSFLFRTFNVPLLEWTTGKIERPRKTILSNVGCMSS